LPQPPNPQSPIPNPQSPFAFSIKNIYINKIYYLYHIIIYFKINYKNKIVN